jgi:hypothetical protein
MKPLEHVVVCRCAQDAIAFERTDWYEHYNDTGKFIDSDYQVSLWRMGSGYYAYSLKDRIRHIWYIIKHGHPWVDFVVLDEKQMLEIASIVKKLVDECPTKLESDPNNLSGS